MCVSFVRGRMVGPSFGGGEFFRRRRKRRGGRGRVVFRGCRLSLCFRFSSRVQRSFPRLYAIAVRTN